MEHPHLKHLRERSERNHSDKKALRQSKELEHEREVTIMEAPNTINKDFWCDDCDRDVVLIAHKSIESDWTNKSQRIAYHSAQCPCGAILKRRITDMYSDPYFLSSETLNKQRVDMHKDLLQPHESGFNMLYG